MNARPNVIKMNRNVIYAIYLHLFIGLIVATVISSSINRNALPTNAIGSNQRQRGHLRWTSSKDMNNVSDKTGSPAATKATVLANKRELFFGVLLPSFARGHRRCVYEAVLPAMDLAIKKVQRPGGPLFGFNITIEHRDTRCSSTYGPLAAFELFTKRKPGSVTTTTINLIYFFCDLPC